MRLAAVAFFGVALILSVIGPLVWLDRDGSVLTRDTRWLLGLIALIVLGLKTWFADFMADRTFNVQKATTDVVITLGAAVVCFAIAQWGATSTPIFPGSVVILGDDSGREDVSSVTSATNLLACLCILGVVLSVACSAGGKAAQNSWVTTTDIGSGVKDIALGAMALLNLVLGGLAWMVYFMIVVIKG